MSKTTFHKLSARGRRFLEEVHRKTWKQTRTEIENELRFGQDDSIYGFAFQSTIPEADLRQLATRATMRGKNQQHARAIFVNYVTRVWKKVWQATAGPEGSGPLSRSNFHRYLNNVGDAYYGSARAQDLHRSNA